ncbi:hypothetical protein [Falsiroseomonas selenitidurans]|uniref:Uncharacterized protein n=1 Tax=Falsiroseomonas selenitidurans TaxID=2716335 RepID=A0ABX1DZP8_9PROT|nr:hypothetical protein [Falsiroseomonas selenitidurans]NKC30333.1 hypothetical protein [Falsiroseomonas selenitidurans]
MTPQTAGRNRPPRAPDLVAASLLTSDDGAEIHLIARNGQLLRLPTDEATARQLVIGLWRALDRQR